MRNGIWPAWGQNNAGNNLRELHCAGSKCMDTHTTKLYHDHSNSYFPLPGYFVTTNTPSPQMDMKMLSYHKNTLGYPWLTSSLYHVPKTLPTHHNTLPCPQDSPSLRHTVPCPYDTPPYHYNVPRSPPPHT